MTMDVLLVAAGLVLLGVGGEVLVRGAVGLAVRLKLTPAVIGLTVVSAGTSMPELVASLIANLEGNPDVAVGNVIGSNIFNIGLILGLCSLVIVLPVEKKTIKIEWPFLLLVTLFASYLMGDGLIGRVEGLLFIVVLVGFMWIMIHFARWEVDSGGGEGKGQPRALVAWALVLAGVVLLPLGGKFVVDGATELALRVGVSQRVIGLTIVAMGTSLPELASSLIAATRGRTDVAVGNIIGSNMFNLLAILGSVAVIRPLTVGAAFFRWDVWWMIAFTVLLAPILYWGRRRVSRIDGVVLLTAFVAYMALLARSQ
jgi:cation:H+ antiporter